MDLLLHVIARIWAAVLAVVDWVITGPTAELQTAVSNLSWSLAAIAAGVLIFLLARRT